MRPGRQSHGDASHRLPPGRGTSARRTFAGGNRRAGEDPHAPIRQAPAHVVSPTRTSDLGECNFPGKRNGRGDANCRTLWELEPVWKLQGALRRGILAVAKAALEGRSARQRAVRNEPTPAPDKRPAARRVFGEKAGWLRPARECFRSCSVVAARSASFVAPSGLFPENSAPRSFQTGSKRAGQY